MAIQKQPIYSHLVRRIPEQFSWVDHRLVREHFIDHISHGAAALYLFLVTVSDANGLSYYGDATLGKRLNMDDRAIESARNRLIEQRLIGWKRPIYQILALEPRRHPMADYNFLQTFMGGGHD